MLAQILASRKVTEPELRAIFDTHRDRVFTVALACLEGDRAAAEDATQEVFVRVAQKLFSFRGEAQLTTWLHRVTINVCRDELRRRQRARRLLITPLPESAQEPTIFSRRRELHEALAALPENLRAPILLRYFDGLSYEEIATQLKCPVGTVATRLHRGLRRLEKALGEEPES